MSMTATDEMNTAEAWIESQDTHHARTLQEEAKYLVATVLPRDMPHPLVWDGVLRLAYGF